MKKIIPIIAVISLLLTSCGTSVQQSEKPQVYASFYAMYDFARTVCGDDADVYLMCPVGTEPHDYEPKTSDMAKLTESDMFIYNGAGMESWADKVSDTLPDSVKVVCTTEDIQTEGRDPHVWLSLENAKKQLDTICNAVSEIDSAHTQNYRSRTDEYLKQIDELKNEYNAAAFNGETLLVTHGAYGYLCRENGLEQLSLSETSDDSEPSPAQMAQTVEAAKNHKNVKAIYYDPLDGDKLAKSVANEANIETLTLYTFEGDTENRDYITLMKDNLEQLKKLK